MFKKKYSIWLLIIIFILPIIWTFNAIRDDKKDNIPDSIEKFIPLSVKQFLIENIFYKKKLLEAIENRQKRIAIKGAELAVESQIVDKLLHNWYDDGLDNLKFDKITEEQILSKNKKNYKLTKFKTDYLSGNTWPHTKATAYLDKFNDNIFLISKDGVISYFNIDELKKEKFQTKIISHNIKDLINYDDWWSKPGGKGLKDILIDDGKIYISFSNMQKDNCWNTSILVAKIQVDKLNFEKFFEPPTCVEVRKGYNRFSHNAGGGRIVKFGDENLLFSHGGFKTRVKAQDDISVFGKIISINKNSKDWSIVSKGHRNVQGLFYYSDANLIINTEHGPQGGDEININDLTKNSDKNFGWPISSYGEHYGNLEKNKLNYQEAPLNKSHSEFGFIEPAKFFVPSIGISEVKKISSNFDKDFINDYFIGALGFDLEEGDKSIHHIRLNSSNNDLIYHDIIGIGERIRDILYLEEINKVLLFLENTASIAILEG